MMLNKIKRGEIPFFSQIASLPKSIKRAALLTFVYYLGWALVNPFYSIYIKNALGNYTNFGIIMFLYFTFSLLLDFPVGELVDRVKPKTLLLISLLFYLPFSYVLLNLSEIWHFVLYTLYHAFISVVLWIALESYIRGHSPAGKEMLSFGLYDAGWVGASVIGGVLGGLLFGYLGFGLIWSISIFAFIAIFVLMLLPDKKKGSIQDGLKSSFRMNFFKKEIDRFLKNPELRGLYFNIFIYKFCFGFLTLMIPLFFLEFNASYLLIGCIFALLYLPAIFEPYYALIPNKKRVVITGISVIIGLFLLMFFIKNVYLIFLLIILTAIPFAMIIPIFQGKVTALIPKKKVGEMTGMIYFTSHMAMAIGPLTAGILADNFGIHSIFLLGCGLFVILLIFNIKKEY